MLLDIFALFAGFGLLIFGADKFVQGASGTALNFGISPLIIGLTIVGFGTSAPEMLVSLMAALNGNPVMAVGNAIGSNITNVALVLGVTALVVPLSVKSATLKREYPIMFVVMLLVWYLLADGDLDKLEGWFLLILMCLVLALITFLGMRDQSHKDEPLVEEFNEDIPRGMSTAWAIFWLLAGLLILVLSSKILVWGAVNIAKSYEVSDLIIGLTIIAIGTSLPELAASIAGALKGEHDIAVGNVIGSNIFNLLGVLGIPAVISPMMDLPDSVMQRDYPLMIGLSVLMFIFAYGFKGEGRINRIDGGLLTLMFAGYMLVIYFSI